MGINAVPVETAQERSAYHIITERERKTAWRTVASAVSRRMRVNPVFTGLDITADVFWSNGWQTQVFVVKLCQRNGMRELSPRQLLELSAYTVQHSTTYISTPEPHCVPRIHTIQRIEWSNVHQAFLVYYSQDPSSRDKGRPLGWVDSPYHYPEGSFRMDRLCPQGPHGWN